MCLYFCMIHLNSLPFFQCFLGTKLCNFDGVNQKTYILLIKSTTIHSYQPKENKKNAKKYMYIKLDEKWKQWIYAQPAHNIVKKKLATVLFCNFWTYFWNIQQNFTAKKSSFFCNFLEGFYIDKITSSLHNISFSKILLWL